MKVNSGMILSHPSIMDIPLNMCSNGCIYCFATNKDFKYNQKSCLNKLMKMLSKNDFFANRAKEGYPITISNISDMFAASNIKSAPQILDLLYNNGIEVYFQTKTSLGMVDIVKNHVQIKQIFYITITTNNDALSKIIEPNAPNYSERLQIVKELIDLGHGVQIGINPTYYGFMNTEDAKVVMRELLAIGVDGFVLQYLHLNKNIRDKYKKLPIIGSDVDNILLRTNENRNEHFFELMKEFYPYVKFYNQPTYTTFWDNYYSVYKYIPTCQTFSNYCIDKYGDQVIEIGFDEYYSVMRGFEDFFNGYGKKLDDYVISNNRSSWIGHPENQNIQSVKDLLHIFWRDKYIKSSPNFNELFTRVERNKEITYTYNGGKFMWRRSRKEKEDIEIGQDKKSLFVSSY